MVTDGCATGIAGIVSQGNSWKTAKITAFYSAKLNLAQQNYPVHEIEMLASVEMMLHHCNILQAVKFKWVTDHKGLEHLLRQWNLSGQQACWIEKISEFNFKVVYVPGSENIVVDTLSRMYSADTVGTVHAQSEYMYFHMVNEDNVVLEETMMPVLTSLEASMAVQKCPHKALPGAETGQPETTKEFAAHVKNHFILHPPAERKEGGGGKTNEPLTNSKKLTIKLPA